MKEIRVLFFSAAFLLIVLAVQIEAEWLLYGVASLYLMEGVLERIHERRKKAKAIFLVYDKKKTIESYSISLGLITAICIFLLPQDIVSLAFYSSYVLWMILSRMGDVYFLLDQQGIKTARKSLNYSQIREMQLTDQGLKIETDDRSEGIVIGKKLLNADVLIFLESKLKVVHPA